MDNKGSEKDLGELHGILAKTLKEKTCIQITKIILI